MLVSGLLVVCSGGKELTVWAEFVFGGQHCDEILIGLWGLVYSMTEENHGTLIFNT
jgi:hypothetical protein